ncbi:hypothetical protein OROGR_029123 [Orobanche gracilis]
MAGPKFLTLLYASSRSSLINPSAPFFYNLIKNYGQEIKGGKHGRSMEERAPSTAEEFVRVAEEKAKEAQQGVASQTVEKAVDGAEEAILGDSKVESVKKRYKEHEPGTDYHRKGD